MTEYLHTKLVDTLKAHSINPALSEDEIDSYPYVTFELPVEYRYTKDGPYKIVGNLTIRSVSDDFDEADALRAAIETAIDGGFNGVGSDTEEAEEANPDVVDVDEADTVEVTETEPEPADEEDPEDPDTPIPDDPEDPEPGSQEIPVDSEDPETEDPVVEGVYSARLTDIRKDCMDGIWVIELDYILNQYA